jgi:alpha/beta superfamily hydrolase
MGFRRYRLPAMTDDPVAGPDTFETDDGETLESAWSGTTDARAVAVLTHPHPRYGGDMHNIVPVTLSRVLPEHGIATVRFNFRGTGRSTGTHGGGQAEAADVRAAVDVAAATFEGRPVVAVGYSFGADVLLAVEHRALRAVVAVAPPLAVLPVEQLRSCRGTAPTLVLAAEHDQFRPADDAGVLVAQWPGTRFGAIAGADHFLAGATGRVADAVVEFVEPLITG